jgi:hypothetical protein
MLQWCQLHNRQGITVNRLIKYLGIGIFLLACLSACETTPVVPEATSTPPPQDIQFVDLQGFDANLSHALATDLPRVEVSFYDRISPSALPLRLQTWLSSVESGGGKIKVTPPKSDVTAKDPFLLMSLASSLWSASKLAKETAAKHLFASAHAYDAEVVLKDDGTGQNVVDHIVFAKRAK